MEENKNIEEEQPREIISSEQDSAPVTEEQTSSIPDHTSYIKDMETHAHHLHHAPGKKIWHYFYEFLMLFLAVFCGFIAENWREHMVERKKEKEYMRSMLADLQKDTAQLKISTTWLDSILVATDKTVTLLNSEKLNDSIVKEVYRLNELTFRFVKVELDDRTASQLKNAGGMRLILDKTVLDSLADYWYAQKTLYSVQDNLQLQKTKAHDVQLRILSQKYYTPAGNPFEMMVTGNPQFINGSEILLPEYCNRLVLCREITKNCKKFFKRQSDLAGGLMTLIKREYHLE